MFNRDTLLKLKDRLWYERQRLKIFFFGPPKRVKLGYKYVGPNEPVFVIAEIGINHNGDKEIARKLVDAAVDAGVDSVKFQLRDLEDLYGKDVTGAKSSENLTTQYSLDLLSKVNLSAEDIFELMDYAKSRDVFPICTPFDLASVKKLEEYGLGVYKISSPDMTNDELLRAVAATRKPMIVSTGMSDEGEIRGVNRLLRKLGAKYVLLHCNSTYPAPFQDIQLQLMERLGTSLYGYSGHERGVAVAVAAVARGAKVVEKHITLDREMEGTDHKASLLPGEFVDMVRGIREVEQSLGTARRRVMTQGERMNRNNLAKSIMAATDIKKGTIITRDLLKIKSPGRGLQPNRMDDLVGTKTNRDIASGDVFYPNDLTSQTVQPRDYTFSRPWGVPVRYHDYKEMLTKIKPDLLEFHMSYRDMDIYPKDFFDKKLDIDLVVHSPETFAGDHLMNFASKDTEYRERSIKELQAVIDRTRELGAYFNGPERIPIIVNIGGFTKDAPATESEKEEGYRLIAEGLKSLDQEGVEIIIQTMPPYPWLLGGQMFHNLFMHPDEIVAFCEMYGYRVCFDVSHSKLACNNFDWSWEDFVDKVAPYTVHLHIVDSAGQGEEGLQIGDGDMDFEWLATKLKEKCPEATFIPEIWQGHENGGNGFWVALDRLEKVHF